MKGICETCTNILDMFQYNSRRNYCQLNTLPTSVLETE